MKVLIIEDEELTARKLKRLLAAVEPQAEVLQTMGSIETSVTWLKANPCPDLILMDIELSDGKSFEIFQQYPLDCPVIFTTAYDEYAIRAFKCYSIDYLLKPIKEEDLRKALDKFKKLKTVFNGAGDALQTIHKLLAQLRPPASSAYRERFMIKQGQKLQHIAVEEVAYFFSKHKISFIKTYGGHEWMLDYTMDEIVQMLDPNRFFRLNRQIIAALTAVEKVHLHFNQKLLIQLHPPFTEEVIVSRERAKDFRRWLGE